MGIWLMFCMPPATIKSAVPDMIACAPNEIACWLDPHWRSTVTPGTSSGYPAASHDNRAMLPACGPIASTQPAMTSSTALGSTSTRSKSPRHAAAPRSTGCTPASEPLRLPTAVRTASMTYASGIFALLGCGGGDSTEDYREVLAANLFGRQWTAWLIPADRNPCGVADEPVHQVDVDVGPEVAPLDALVEQVQPHLALVFVARLDEGELRQGRQPLGLVLIDDDLGVPVFDCLERRHEQPLEPFERIGFGVDDLLIATEQPVQEIPQHLLHHLLFALEMVIQAAGQNARGIGDVAHGRRAQPALGEHRRGELQQLVAAARKRPVHPPSIATKRLLGKSGPGCPGPTSTPSTRRPTACSRGIYATAT